MPLLTTGAGTYLAAAGGVVTTRWDTVTFGANFTFSNSNQDATKLSASAGWTSIKADTGKNSGKLYFEEKIVGPGSDFGYVGIADAGAGLNSFITDNAGHDTFGKDWRGGNGIEQSGAFSLQASLLSPTISVGDVIGFAVDFAAGKIWMAQNNNFAAFKVGSDPASATNHLATFTAGTTLFPAGSAYGGGSGDVVIRLAASGTFAFSPPSGFSTWS